MRVRLEGAVGGGGRPFPSNNHKTMQSKRDLDAVPLRAPQQPLPDRHHSVPSERWLTPPGEARLFEVV